MAPCNRPLKDKELNDKVQTIVDLGFPACDVKARPSCRIGSPFESLRRENWGFKALRAHIGADKYV